MKNKTVYFTHSLSLCALFVLGNAIIILPRANADEFSFLGYLISCVVALLLFFIINPLIKNLFCEDILKNSKPFKKFLLYLLYAAICIASLWCAADTFGDFIEFVSKVILPDTSLFLIAVTFLAIVIFFVLKSQEAILKFSLLSFWFIVIAVLFFFIATFKNFDFRNIFIFRLGDIKTIIKNTSPYILNPVLPSMLLPIYITLSLKGKHTANTFSGILSGLIILGVCILSAMLIFGPQFAGELKFPYSSAVSTVTVGRLFTRMDGFSYFIYFACALIKINVCSFIILKILKIMAFK